MSAIQGSMLAEGRSGRSVLDRGGCDLEGVAFRAHGALSFQRGDPGSRLFRTDVHRRVHRGRLPYRIVVVSAANRQVWDDERCVTGGRGRRRLTRFTEDISVRVAELRLTLELWLYALERQILP